MPVVGDTLVWTEALTDASGNPVSGEAANFSVVTARKPNGTTSFSPSIAEIGTTGSYRATVTSDQAGTWYLFWRHVDAVTGEITGFSDSLIVDADDGMTQARAAKLDSLGVGTAVLTTAPIAVNGTLSLVQATDYATSEGRQLDWTTSDAGTWPDLTSGTVLFVAKPQGSVTRPSFSVTGSIIAASGSSKHVRVEIPRATTAAVSADVYDYQVQATFTNAHVLVLVSGTLDLSEFLT